MLTRCLSSFWSQNSITLLFSVFGVGPSSTVQAYIQFSWWSSSLSKGRDARILAIPAETIKTFYSNCCRFEPKFHTCTSLVGQWWWWWRQQTWRGISIKYWVEPLLSKSRILSQWIIDPAWRRSIEKGWWWGCCWFHLHVLLCKNLCIIELMQKLIHSLESNSSNTFR